MVLCVTNIPLSAFSAFKMAELNSFANEIFFLLVIFKFLGFVPWCVDAKHESGLSHFKIEAHQVLKCFATNVSLFTLIIYSVISEYIFKQVTSYPTYILCLDCYCAM